MYKRQAQDLRRIYTCRSRAQAEHRLYLWMVHCADAGVPELTRLARTIDAWREEFLAYFDTAGVSNERASHCTFYRGSDAAGLVGLLVV